MRGVGWLASMVRGEVVPSVVYLAWTSATSAGCEEESLPRLKRHVVVTVAMVAVESRQRSSASQKGGKPRGKMRRSKTMLYTGML
jgi:hypothetical protein